MRERAADMVVAVRLDRREPACAVIDAEVLEAPFDRPPALGRRVEVDAVDRIEHEEGVGQLGLDLAQPVVYR